MQHISAISTIFESHSHLIMSDSEKYVHIKSLNAAPYSQIILSRLKAEDIDYRVRNDISSSIYAMSNFQMSLDVRESQAQRALEIIAKMEADAERPNMDLDFREADMEDIAFEKEIYEQDQKISNAKPPIVLFLIIILIAALAVLFYTY